MLSGFGLVAILSFSKRGGGTSYNGTIAVCSLCCGPSPALVLPYLWQPKEEPVTSFVDIALGNLNSSVIYSGSYVGHLSVSTPSQPVVTCMKVLPSGKLQATGGSISGGLGLRLFVLTGAVRVDPVEESDAQGVLDVSVFHIRAKSGLRLPGPSLVRYWRTCPRPWFGGC